MQATHQPFTPLDKLGRRFHRTGVARLEKAARANSVDEIGGLVQELTEKLQAVNAELRKAG